MQLEIGRTVDRYLVEGLLGQGGLAEVYRVRHTVLGTSHALKVLFLPSPKIRQRLLQEGAIQANLRHPNIVAVTDVIEVDGAPGLVMELIEGPPLDLHLQNGPLAIADLESWGRGILAGVGAAHARGMIHRDLKPANVLLSPAGRGFVPKVTDFGLAKILGGELSDSKTRSGATMGTPLYMAPEQIVNAKNVDVRADVFSLGALLYEMATGMRAFEGEDVADTLTRVRDARFVPIEEFRPDLPDRLASVITGALVRDPDRRVGDASEMLAAWTGKKAVKKQEKPNPAATWDDNAPVPAARRPTPPTVVIEPLQPAKSLDGLPSIHHDPLGISVAPNLAPPPPPEEPPEERRLPLWVVAVPLVPLLLAVVWHALAAPTKPKVVATEPPPPSVAAPIAGPTGPLDAPSGAVKRPVVPKVTGTLRLRSRPNAEIKLDGRDAGDTANFQRVLSSGPHKVFLASHNSTETTTLTVIVPENDVSEICWDFAQNSFCQ